MLATYQALTLGLLQAPSSPVPLISTASLTQYINIARNQTAADAECIRNSVFMPTVAGTQRYLFSDFTSLAEFGTGSPIAVRSARLPDGPLDFRSWEWFAAYYLYRTESGTPAVVAQQVSGTYGALSFYPIPDRAIAILLDLTSLPIPLIDDVTPEAISPLWQDAVPFYAAWLALQTLQRQNDADRMLARYRDLVRRGRQLSTSTELPGNMPGGMGAQLAASKTTLGTPPQQGAR